MKLEYEKPELEEIEIVLEGSFLDTTTEKKPNEEYEGEDWG